MKELLKKVFSQKTSSLIFVGFGTFSIFTFIVIPCLISSLFILNLISVALGLFTIIFLYYYIKMDRFLSRFINVEPGETELDYINPNELKPKNKKIYKEFIDKESPVKFVKLKKKFNI